LRRQGKLDCMSHAKAGETLRPVAYLRIQQPAEGKPECNDSHIEAGPEASEPEITEPSVTRAVGPIRRSDTFLGPPRGKFV
jgi:hypothetical protein